MVPRRLYSVTLVVSFIFFGFTAEDDFHFTRFRHRDVGIVPSTSAADSIYTRRDARESLTVPYLFPLGILPKVYSFTQCA